MKKILLFSLSLIMLSSACSKRRCYMCVTEITTDRGYSDQPSYDTAIVCGMTRGDARSYEASHSRIDTTRFVHITYTTSCH